MSKKLVKDFMLPISEYATVVQDATLCDAVESLEKAQEDFDQGRYPHRGVIVLDDEGNVVGKLGHIDILRALEPKYEHIDLERFGFSKQFMSTLLEKFNLWEEPLDNICKKAFEKKVKNIVDAPSEGELIDEGASISEAIHQLVMGCHQSLLVTQENKVVGILRLTDVFREVSEMIKVCKL